MSYEPPKHGCPCWIQVLSTDVARAKQFYSQVFGWDFKPATEEYPAERVALFSYPDPKLSMLGGGIVKKEADQIKRKGGGGVVYHYVNSIEDTLAKIKDEGGKKVGECEQEGPGWTQHFEDSEENYCGLFAMGK